MNSIQTHLNYSEYGEKLFSSPRGPHQHIFFFDRIFLKIFCLFVCFFCLRLDDRTEWVSIVDYMNKQMSLEVKVPFKTKDYKQIIR